MSDEKTLEPTPHRRQQARLEGHVAKSQDLAAAIALLAGLGAVMMLGGGLAGFSTDYCRGQLGGPAWLTVDQDFLVARWNQTLAALGRRLLPILGLIFLAGAAAGLLQVGFLFVPRKLAMDLGRIDPLGGLRRIFSTAGAVHLAMSTGKLLAVLAVGGAAIYHQREALVGLGALGPPALARQMTQIVLATALKVGAALLALAAVDYLYQRWRHEQDLKMTPQELREELRNLEGDPRTVARRKQAGRGLAAQRIEKSE